MSVASSAAEMLNMRLVNQTGLGGNRDKVRGNGDLWSNGGDPFGDLSK